jgi:hypothetical protein
MRCVITGRPYIAFQAFLSIPLEPGSSEVRAQEPKLAHSLNKQWDSSSKEMMPGLI